MRNAFLWPSVALVPLVLLFFIAVLKGGDPDALFGSPEEGKSKTFERFKLNLRKVELWFSAVFLPFCIFVWVTSGYIYVPMYTNEGFFLPLRFSFLIAVIAAGLSLSSALSIMLYRKVMPDKKRQILRIRRNTRETAIYLLILVIPVWAFQWLALLLFDLDLFPFRGVAGNLVLWRPEMASLAGFFNDGSLLVGLIVALSAAAVLAVAFYFSRLKRLSYYLLSLSIFCVGFCGLTTFAEEYFSGAMKYGDGIIYAIQDPARFNSMALTCFAIVGLCFSWGTAILMTGFKAPKSACQSG